MKRLKQFTESDWFCLVGWAATAVLIVGGVLFAE